MEWQGAAMVWVELRLSAVIVRPERLRTGRPMSPQPARLNGNQLAIAGSPPLLGEGHPTAPFTKQRSLLRASTLISQPATMTVRTTTSYQPLGRAQANSSRAPATLTTSCAD
jgi:hypothetical protein